MTAVNETRVREVDVGRGVTCRSCENITILGSYPGVYNLSCLTCLFDKLDVACMVLAVKPRLFLSFVT